MRHLIQRLVWLSLVTPLALIGVRWTYGEEIKGKVTNVMDGSVQFASDSDLLPNSGDKTEFYIELKAIKKAALITRGVVTDVQEDVIVVKLDDPSAKIREGQLARIDSSQPRKKGSAAATQVGELRRFDGVRSAIFLPGEQQIVTGSRVYTYLGNGQYDRAEDCPLRVWDVRTGQQVGTFGGHRGFATSLSLSADGQYLLSGSDDRTMRRWDVKTRYEVTRMETSQYFIEPAVAFLPDGRRGLSCAKEGSELTLWDLETGKAISTLGQRLELGDFLKSVAVSADGTRAVTGGFSGGAHLFDVENGYEMRLFKGHTWWTNCATFSPDGRHLLTGSSDRTLRLWDVESGQEIRRFEGHTEAIYCVAVSADGRRALSGGEDLTVRLWDVETGKELASFTHATPVWSVVFSRDGKRGLSASQDCVKLWQLP